MGRRKRERQAEFWVASEALPQTPRHVFYDLLNRLLDEAKFDQFVESVCEPHYARETGRGSIPPGRYFRMLLVGYFEGIDSQRGIAWRCADSLSLRQFLFLELHETAPDHSSLTRVRNRLPLEVHERVFQFVLSLAERHKLLRGKTVAVDSTMLEANAAMKSIVRRDSGEDWKAYLRRLMQEQGLIEDGHEPTDEELRRFDKSRQDKKVSNDEWTSPTDPDSRIAKMKDGRTHLAHKAEHAVDLETGAIVGVTVQGADQGDTTTIAETVTTAAEELEAVATATADHTVVIDEVVADKGYHSNQVLVDLAALDVRTYIAEPDRGRRNWRKKPAARDAVYA
ncbi:MAG: transposase, partial [Planctomycetaceae bacterium]